MRNLLLACFLCIACTALCKIQLPTHFTNNMVLQQKSNVTISGKGKELTTITITTGWNKKQYNTTCDATGKWNLQLPTPKAGGPYTLTFSDGEDFTTLHNVLIGEVWFCSGQSNMEMPLAGWGKVLNYQQEIEAADYSQIRLFQVKKVTALTPQNEVVSNMDGWQECSPTSVAEFSSLAYFYARELWQKLKIPIGVIDCSWGGTPAEAWTSAQSLRHVMGYENEVEALMQFKNQEQVFQYYEQERAKWENNIFLIDKGYNQNKECWTNETYNDTEWKEMLLPNRWETQGLTNFDGVVWFRKMVNIPPHLAGKDLKLNLGPIDDEDVTYWNGEVIARGSGYNQPRQYSVPGKLVKAGNNILTIRVFDTGGEGGFTCESCAITLTVAEISTINLSGVWKYKIGCSIKDLPAAPINPSSSSYPTVLYNAMVHPFTTFPVKGFIWYQGEANVGRAVQYESLFKTMIMDWRRQFNNSDMPFYFIQLANYLQRKELQSDSEWAALREAQEKALALSQTGMVVNIDLGDAFDIHPKNKQEVARRLAAIALSDTYNQKVPASAPIYRNFTVVKENEVEIFFTLPNNGEPFKEDNNIKGFTMAGPDHVFYVAEAQTHGNKVIVKCDKVPYPVAIRYGWADNPECTLHTTSNFYVAPFRSDNW